MTTPIFNRERAKKYAGPVPYRTDARVLRIQMWVTGSRERLLSMIGKRQRQ